MAGSHFDISISTSINIRKVRKTCVNRGYINISTRNGTFSIFLCLCLCLCLGNPGSHMFFSLTFLMLMLMLVFMPKCEPALSNDKKKTATISQQQKQQQQNKLIVTEGLTI